MKLTLAVHSGRNALPLFSSPSACTPRTSPDPLSTAPGRFAEVVSIEKYVVPRGNTKVSATRNGKRKGKNHCGLIVRPCNED